MTKLLIDLEDGIIKDVPGFAASCVDHLRDRSRDTMAEPADTARLEAQSLELRAALCYWNAALIDMEEDRTGYNRTQVARAHEALIETILETCQPFITGVCEH